MITWTAAGAVESPTMLQVRVEQRFEGRIEAGAPNPERSLTPEELLDNLRYFTEERRGPRTSPCTSLVLSGQGVVAREDLRSAIQSARSWGVERVTLHLGEGDIEGFDVPSWRGWVDTLVVPVVLGGVGLAGSEALMALANKAGISVVSNLQLDSKVLENMGPVLEVICRVRPQSAVFTHPFPRGVGDTRVLAPLDVVLSGLRAAQCSLKAVGIPWVVKGLPVCWLNGLVARPSRSSNRWYVDAAHQREEALLFFPDVVHMSKAEPCRFCSRNSDCDGFFDEWLARGGYPALKAIED